MNNKQVATAFAQGKTTGKGSNLFISGDTIYSYGWHFPIATWKEDGTVIFKHKKYSASTSLHQSLVRNALAMKGITV